MRIQQWFLYEQLSQREEGLRRPANYDNCLSTTCCRRCILNFCLSCWAEIHRSYTDSRWKLVVPFYEQREVHCTTDLSVIFSPAKGRLYGRRWTSVETWEAGQLQRRLRVRVYYSKLVFQKNIQTYEWNSNNTTRATPVSSSDRCCRRVANCRQRRNYLDARRNMRH